MAIKNSIELAVKYINDPNNFNQIYKRESLTKDLESVQLKFLDANTIKQPNYGFSETGIGTYNRNTGARLVNLVETWDTYELTQDNSDSLYLDVMDDEETLSEGLIRRANEFTRRNLIPSVDAYRFSVITTPATTKTVGAHVVSQLPSTEENIIARINYAFQLKKEREIPLDGLILYVTPATKTLMENSKQISKYFHVQTGVGNVDTRIEYYNGAKIIEVPSARLGEDIEFVLVQPKLLAVALKFNESVFVNATTTTSNLFGNFWKYRLYHDIFFSKGAALPIKFAPEGDEYLINPGVFVHKNDGQVDVIPAVDSQVDEIPAVVEE